MSSEKPRWPAALALVASLLGFVFAGLSTLDYISHLDRQEHDIHCSFVPGLAADHNAENPCRTAMYSPYAALFRDTYWGGVPISLFAVGAFTFLAAFALYLLLARSNAPRRASQFMGIFGVTPLIASLVMFTISAVRLGTFCKTCVGIYASSILLAVGSIAILATDRQRRAPAALPPDKTMVDEAPYAGRPVPPTVVTSPDGHLLLLPAWMLALALFAVTPALLYISALPSYGAYITGCGKLEKSPQGNAALLHVTPPGARQPVVLFVDPLCPTCKAFHQRLDTEGFMEKLDITLSLFPLDNECNWMLDQAVHPGACVLSKAILCGEHRAMQVLSWSYANQEKILELAKSGAGIVNVRAMVKERWPELDACIDQKDTTQRLHKMLRYAVDNRLPVSTPQMFINETKLCVEDSDMGLSYTLRRLAPALAEAK